MPSALELLALQAPVDTDAVIARVSESGQVLAIGDAIPDAIAHELRRVFAGGPLRAPHERPAVIAALLGGLAYTAGPVYSIPRSLPVALDVVFERDHERLASANPGNWHPVEWQELLDGRLGPFAIATVDGRVASICHTPGPLTPRTAEAGVWTHPEFRGRGLASATVAAWSRLALGDRHLFYSTDRANHSSQRVAARLQLPLLGWTHRFAPARTPRSLHPLCSVQ